MEQAFDGLEQYASAPYIDVRTRRIYNLYKPGQQIELRGEFTQRGKREDAPIIGEKIKQHLGDFFEVLAQGIFGGQRKVKAEVRYDNQEVIREIDLFLKPEKRLIEVKSVMQKGNLKLVHAPLGGDAALQIMEQYKDWLIDYVIVRHRTRDLPELSRQSLINLERAIAENISSMAVLPFSLIYQIHAVTPQHCSRYSQGDYRNGNLGNLTEVRPPYLDNLLNEPEKAIIATRLNPCDYEIEKRRFPEDVTIDDIRIASFPVLLIRDKDHAHWQGVFKEEVVGDLGRIETAKKIKWLSSGIEEDLKKAEEKLRDLKRLEEESKRQAAKIPPAIEHIARFGEPGGKRIIISNGSDPEEKLF